MKKTTRKVPQSVKTQRKIDAAVGAALKQQSHSFLSVKQNDEDEIQKLENELAQAFNKPHEITPDYVSGLLEQTHHTGVVVKNWKNGWKWFSNLALAAIVAVNTSPIPPELLDALPPDARQKVTIGLAVFGLLGRFINQSRKKDDADV
ncbi:hypothetical protein WCE00_01735 [Acinetobacter haemolyticus]|uniref:DUF7940 domain-containing protein n=1 Tax=Acinetobacter haemolyticus TaxID=29430 RepID=UPI0034D5DCA3